LHVQGNSVTASLNSVLPLDEMDASGVAAVFTDVDDTLTWHAALVAEASRELPRR